MSDQLHDCPKCGTKNFTAKGLASHNCAKHAARRDASLAVAGAAVPAINHAEMGAQLTAQYHRAVNAMPEILRFGAMMILLRDHLFHDGKGDQSVRGKDITGNGVKGDGVKGWLAQHAPDVKLSTAYRFECVTLSIAEDYAELVGPKVAKQYALPELVTADASKLPPFAAKKQQELFDHVAGTSQKSWLDKFRPAGGRGGDRGKQRAARTLTAEEAAAALRDICVSAGAAVDLMLKQQAFTAVAVDAELDGLHDLLADALTAVAAWRKLTKTEREARLAAIVNA
jgi:hypothetical protein